MNYLPTDLLTGKSEDRIVSKSTKEKPYPGVVKSAHGEMVVLCLKLSLIDWLLNLNVFSFRLTMVG